MPNFPGGCNLSSHGKYLRYINNVQWLQIQNFAR